MVAIAPIQINEMRLNYRENSDALARLEAFIKENGVSDDGVSNASESFEQGWNNALEYVFRTLGIPLAGEIPDTTKTMLDAMSVHELGQALRNRNEVVAVTIWQEGDIISALEEAGYEATHERVVELSDNVQGGLEDCSHGWEVINDTIYVCNFGDSDLCSEEEKETVTKVLSAVDEALEEYPASKVNVYADDAHEYFDVMICSRNNSFPFKAEVAEYNLGETAMVRLTNELDARHVGYCF